MYWPVVHLISAKILKNVCLIVRCYVLEDTEQEARQPLERKETAPAGKRGEHVIRGLHVAQHIHFFRSPPSST